MAGFADGDAHSVRSSITHSLEKALMECNSDDAAVVSALSEHIEDEDLALDGPITDILSRHFGDDHERA